MRKARGPFCGNIEKSNVHNRFDKCSGKYHFGIRGRSTPNNLSFLFYFFLFSCEVIPPMLGPRYTYVFALSLALSPRKIKHKYSPPYNLVEPVPPAPIFDTGCNSQQLQREDDPSRGWKERVSRIGVIVFRKREAGRKRGKKRGRE